MDRRVASYSRPKAVRRYYKKKMNKGGWLRLFNTSYSKSRQMVHGTWTVTPGAFNGFGIFFALNLTAHPNSYFFDQYRIRYIKVWVHPRQNVSYLSGGNNINNSVIYSSVDYDDATPPTTEAQLLARSNIKSRNQFQPFREEFVPRYSTLVFGTSTSYGVGNRMDWLNTANNSIQYYGYKLGCSPGGVSTDPKLYYDLSIEYYLDFKIGI